MVKDTNFTNNDFEIKGIELVKYNGKSSTVLVPDKVKFVLKSAFENCSFIKSITFKSNLYEIENYAFAGCSSLKELILPNEVNFIGDYVFLGCSNLENIIIPNGVYTIFPNTFKDCEKINTITLPDTVAYFSSFANDMKKITIIAHKGTFAEVYAQKFGCRFIPIYGNLKEGFYPFYTEGRPVVFYNPNKGVRKLIVDKGMFVDFPGFEHTELIMKYYKSENLPNKIRFRTEFIKKENGYIVIWVIQPDGWYYYGDSREGEHIELYACLNDLGEYTSKFQLYKIGSMIYKDIDLK